MFLFGLSPLAPEDEDCDGEDEDGGNRDDKLMGLELDRDLASSDGLAPGNNALGWLTVAIDFFLSIGFGYHAFKKFKTA